MRTPFAGLIPRCLLAVLFLTGCDLWADNVANEQLGTVSFESNGSQQARLHVTRGVKLLHHMMYPEADGAFAAAVTADPSCALAYWGRAMTIIHPLWPDVPADADIGRGAELVRRGLASAPHTPRERAYLTTLQTFFDGATRGYPARLADLDAAWGRLSEEYPEDMDALAFSALFHLAPVRFVAKDKSHRLQLEAARRLEAVAKRIPDHPGAQHYKIHAYDFPLLADRALEVCDTYGAIAPEVPHALHMPTHIFTRRGLWAQSIDYNRRSAQAARKLGGAPGAHYGHVAHAFDYLAYAQLQRGQYRDALATARELRELAAPYGQSIPTIGFALAAVPARCALERQAWAEAARLPIRHPEDFPWQKLAHCESITRFARALGAVRSGQLDAARAELVAQEQLLRKLKGANRYWATQAEAQLLTTRAWLEHASHNAESGIVLMRQAVAVEASADKEAVTPGEVLPAGELLGDLLLETERYAEALAAYEAVLATSPGRLNTLYGAGLAAQRSGQTDVARRHYSSLLDVAANADAGLARVEHARAFLSGHGGR